MTTTLKIAGLPVVDAKRAREVEITTRDITTGDSKDPTNCAVARACKRAFHATQARVYLTRTYLKVEGKWIRYRTPEAVRSEIIAFDRGGSFEPGTYTLAPMPPALKLGARRNTGPKKAKGKKRRAYHVTANIREGAMDVFD